MGAEAFAELMTLVLDLLRRGKVAGVHSHFEPNGIGRVGVTTVDGVEVDLPGVPDDDDATADTVPAKPKR